MKAVAFQIKSLFLFPIVHHFLSSYFETKTRDLNTSVYYDIGTSTRKRTTSAVLAGVDVYEKFYNDTYFRLLLLVSISRVKTETFASTLP